MSALPPTTDIERRTQGGISLAAYASTPQIGDQMDDPRAFRVRIRGQHERSVDLDLVKPQPAQVMEARIARIPPHLGGMYAQAKSPKLKGAWVGNPWFSSSNVSLAKTMVERLGKVLYRMACIAAVVLAAGGVWVLIQIDDWSPRLIGFVIAPPVAAWLIARACRTVFAGRQSKPDSPSPLLRSG